MYSVSMTTRLGLAAVLGAITVVILAYSKDQAPITNRCKAENCAISTNIGQAMRKKVSTSTQQINQSGDDRNTDKSVQAIKKVGPYQISCGEGRAIAAARFNRVRSVKCRGGTYAYLGWRNGVAFRVLIDRRTGRIVGLAPEDAATLDASVDEAGMAIRTVVVRGSADKPVSKKPPQELVENPQYRRPRREDDPFVWREGFN
jgi:hypothetical protein